MSVAKKRRKHKMKRRKEELLQEAFIENIFRKILETINKGDYAQKNL